MLKPVSILQVRKLVKNGFVGFLMDIRFNFKWKIYGKKSI